MNKFLMTALTFPTLAFVSACGGSETTAGFGGAGATAGLSQNYQSLANTATSTSSLNGTSVVINTSSGAVTTPLLTGSYTHNTGALSLSNGQYTLNDTDGMDGNAQFTDGSSTITVWMAGDYALYGLQSYTVNGANHISYGVAGIATQAGHVPSSGTATYTGAADGAVVYQGNSFGYYYGTANVLVNFGANEVDTVMSDFTVMDLDTNQITSGPIDTVYLRDQTISGNTFSGGSIAVANNGAFVDIAGANPTGASSGYFYGYDDAISAPDEIGGVVTFFGQDGAVDMMFLAD